MSINNNNNQEASPSTEPNSLVGYYQGNFEIFSKEGTLITLYFICKINELPNTLF
jgi:hypothetical protein